MGLEDAPGATGNGKKPALELIKTPKEMAELPNEMIAIKEGYHLGDSLLFVWIVYF